MQKAAKRVVPHALEAEAMSCWGLTRIQSYEKFVFSNDMYQIPGRQRAFISEATGAGAQVYFLGGLIDEMAAEFRWMGKSRISLLASLSDESQTPDMRATGIASLIAGEYYSMAPLSEIKNIAAVSSNNLKAALELCLNDVKETPSLIYLSFTPAAADWSQCADLVKQLLQKGVPVIVPAAGEKLENAINVAPIDINDQAPLSTWRSSDIFAPGIEVACSGLGANYQIVSGADVAAAFVASVGVSHLLNIRAKKLDETLMESFLRTCPRTSKSLGIAMLWNPYQLFEPSWDFSQDAFLGSFKWGQKVEITLKCLNVDRSALSFEVTHTDLPGTVKIENAVVKGFVADPNDGSTRCYHFVIKAKYGESESSKMFYITFTDSPFKIDVEKYRNLNESAKGSHYMGNPNPPTRAPYHLTCSCLDGETRILMWDGSEKTISEIQPGDKIKNRMLGKSEVTHKLEVIAAERDLFSVNGGALLLTADHRVHTPTGPAALNYQNEVHIDGSAVQSLQPGSILVTADNQMIEVESIVPAKASSRSLFNLVTDNDAGYIANGICCETEIFTSLLFSRSPQVKGEVFAKVMKG